MSPESGRNSGGDLFGMAKDGTTVPDDATKPRIIPSVPRPGQYGTTLAEAADNASDTPRGSFLRHSYRGTYSTSYSSESTRDDASTKAMTGIGDALPSQVGSKRMHDAPGGVVHDPQAKGSTQFEKHKVRKESDQELGAGEGPQVDKPPGGEDPPDEEVMDKVERKVDA